MTTETQRSYPLYWPEGWPRTESYKIKHAQFKDRSIRDGRIFLTGEIRRFGGTDLIISTNLELKLDGTPRSGQRQPSDRGVAIFFKRDEIDMALACDIYSSVEDNLWALCRTIEALRQIERDGSPALINRAFKGFAALPDPDQRTWWEVLHIPRESDDQTIKQAYRNLARQYHPDNGGDPVMFYQVTKAYDLAMGRAK